MSPRSRRASRIRRGTIGALLTSALAAVSLPLAAPATAAPAGSLAAGVYLVTLADQPLATYDGSVDGIPATRPAVGRKLDVKAANAKRYRAHLIDEQTDVAKKAGATVRQHYAVTTNTFSARLSAGQLVRLAATEGVTGIAPDRLHHATDDRNSTDFLGLAGKKGLWASLGGSAKAGKGVVIGDIDTGIWPESASFKAPALKPGKRGKKPAKKDRYRPYLDGTTTVMPKADGTTFTGTCQTGDSFTAADCNEKIISARYFVDGWLTAKPGFDPDYLSPRDGEGHGTHTASTAAGNANVRATVDGADLGTVSGVAPAAAVAVYKALWMSKDGKQSGGLTSDLVAAIDQAAADGVDVINYSLGKDIESPYNDPEQAALRNAAAAGIFVATAGGNSGPFTSSLDNTAPWTTTVAAGTIAPYTGTVTLGNGKSYTGVSTSVRSTVGSAPLVRSGAVKAAGADPIEADLCVTGTLDPARVAGRIVVCDRGTNPRADKSAEVERAGGIGMVLVNVSDDSTDGDLHSVPTVHLNAPDATTVRDYAATANATATLTPGGTGKAVYPQVTNFSSRGPSLLSNGDLLKPDITAPGASILAAVAPPANHGHDFDFYSGTSMATPHIAGLAALYFSEHPTWSPMSVKSAMMTTASPTRTADGKKSTDAFAQGAGEVEARAMLRPGLVYDSGEQDWLAYLEGVGIDTQTGTRAVDPSDLNYPSIAIGELFDSQTVTRTVTATSAGTYRAEVDLPGVKATVSPSVLHFSHAGQKRTFTVKLKVTTARSGAVDTGSLTWTSGRTTVRSPIVVTPQSVRAPAEINGTGTHGERTYSVTPATSTLTATVHGPVSSPLTRGTLTGNEEVDYEAVIPAGSRASQLSAHFDIADGNIAALIWARVVGGVAQEYGFALPDSDGNSTVTLPQPKAGKLFVAVVANDASGTGESLTPYTYQVNNITDDSPVTGTVTVAPGRSQVTPGTPTDLTTTWSGIPSDARSTAWIEYANGAGTVLTLN
ncbi:S8 family serine peptidase [Streptomyces sp. NPDC002746]